MLTFSKEQYNYILYKKNVKSYSYPHSKKYWLRGSYQTQPRVKGVGQGALPQIPRGYPQIYPNVTQTQNVRCYVCNTFHATQGDKQKPGQQGEEILANTGGINYLLSNSAANSPTYCNCLHSNFTLPTSFAVTRSLIPYLPTATSLG